MSRTGTVRLLLLLLTMTMLNSFVSTFYKCNIIWIIEYLKMGSHSELITNNKLP